MATRILIVQGHPDPAGGHLCHALAAAYAEGAASAGHQVESIEVARLDFPLLRTAAAFQDGAVPAAIGEAQQALRRADHLLLVYPLWLGGPPALLKGFLEQLFRPGFAFEQPAPGGIGKTLLDGRSARIVVTMGMPALVYRWWFGAHSLRSLERNILKFVGIRPVRESLFGLVEAAGDTRRRRWFAVMREHGRRAR